MQILSGFLVIALLYLWIVIRHDTGHFVVREYRIVSPKIREEKTICLLSDLHEKDYGNGNEALAAAIRDAKPDAVISAGDLVTSHHAPASYHDEAVTALLEALAGEFPVYAAYGNHERKITENMREDAQKMEAYERRLSQTGVTFLRDEKPAELFPGTDLAAINLDSSYFTHGAQKALSVSDITQSCGTPDENRFTVLAAHEPSRFPVYADWGADLVLSGHVHGGIARLFGRGVINPALRLFPFYDGGAFVRFSPDGPSSVLYGGRTGKANADGVVRHPAEQVLYLKKGASAMIESRGLGTHSIHIRFRNPGELVIIRLSPET